MNRILWLLLLISLMLTSMACAQTTPLRWDAKEFMGVEEISAGMLGYGKTVYQGTRVERFNVEVVGVLKKIDFGFDMILIRVTSGPLVERKLQTVSGMSGSPIYIKDRLIGAYAYGWDFQQEAIAGVTPIAAMLESTQPGTAPPALTGALRPNTPVLQIGDRLITRVTVVENQLAAQQLQRTFDPTNLVLSPAATPLFVNGFSNKAMAPLQQLFGKYNLQAMPGPGQMNTPVGALEAGSAVAVSLMEGDVNLSAVGTVTYVKGDTVLAFGHPFMGLGKTNLPMSSAYVHGIINSSQSSFKIASPVKQIGAITTDRSFAVSGQLGQTPAMLPVRMRLQDASRNYDRAFQVSLVHDFNFTPSLLYLYTLFGGASQLADSETAEGTFSAQVSLTTRELGVITQRMAASPLAPQMPMPMAEFYLLVDSLMQNPYQKVTFTDASIDLSYQPERNLATIEKVVPERPIARPGEKVRLFVHLRPYGKPVEIHTVEVTAPSSSLEPAMIVLVSGGVHAQRLQPLLSTLPEPDEGARGIVRWFTSSPPSNTIMTSQVLYTPSLNYRGRAIPDMPPPLLDMLQFADGTGAPHAGIGTMVSDNPQSAAAEEEARALIRPTIHVSALDVPYVVQGGQMVLIGIDDPENKTGMDSLSLLAMLFPTLSTGRIPDIENVSGISSSDAEMYAAFPWFTAQQRNRFLNMLQLMPNGHFNTRLPFSLPKVLLSRRALKLLPLSASLRNSPLPRTMSTFNATRKQDEVTPHVPPNPEVPDTENPEPKLPMDRDTPPPDAGNDNSGNSVLLTRALPQWTLSGWNDYLLGEHSGTSVTSQGRLVVMPRVQLLHQIAGMVPWKMVTTAHGTYLAGWHSANVLRFTGNGLPEPFFPPPAITVDSAETVTAMSNDSQGNIYVATWPDSQVRAISPDGTLLRAWQLPDGIIWDLAITGDGRRFAAGSRGTLYQLTEEIAAPVRIAAQVPDSNVYTMTVATDNSLYFATSPRGKVYRLSATGQVESVFQGPVAITALAVSTDGTLYLGASPDCLVLRMAADGEVTPIMQGVGASNFHIYDMAFSNNDLYVATGPSGGIYRISNPSTMGPEITTIYARRDERDGASNDDSVGPESVMVTALNILSNGEILAATTAPGQVLKISSRGLAHYDTAIIMAGVMARWGQVDVDYSLNGAGNSLLSANTPLRIESRSGRTAWPDTTWSAWQPLTDERLIASPPATFLQLRISMQESPAMHLTMNFLRLSVTLENQQPLVQLLTPTTGERIRGEIEVSWMGGDSNQDQVVYTAFASDDSGISWKPLTVREQSESDAEGSYDNEDVENIDTEDAESEHAEETETAPDAPVIDATVSTGDPHEGLAVTETTMTSFSWDTTKVPDGVYLLQIVATDKYARPNTAKSNETISGRFLVDNTAPAISLADSNVGWESIAQFTVADKLSPIVGGKYRLNDGAWIALVAVDGIFDSQSEQVRLLNPDGLITLPDGMHTLSLIIADAAGNVLARKVNVAIGEVVAPPTDNLPPHPNNRVEDFVWW